MKFKKNPTYFKAYSKEDAVEYLRSLDQVQKVVSTSKSLFIYTHPIKPTNEGTLIPNFFRYPYGSFKIKIYEIDNGNKLNISIARMEGHVPDMSEMKYAYSHSKSMIDTIKKSKEGHNHLHVEPTGSYDQTEHICWGNINDDISRAIRAKDWYWIAKMSLELVQDGHFEESSKLLSLMVLSAMQDDYVKKNYSVSTHKRFRSNLKKQIKEFNEEFYNDIFSDRKKEFLEGLEWL